MALFAVSRSGGAPRHTMQERPFQGDACVAFKGQVFSAPMDWAATNIPDPQNPVGAKGIGEPIQGCAAAALLCAISDALGGHQFNRVPVTADMIVNAASKLPQSHSLVQTNST